MAEQVYTVEDWKSGLIHEHLKNRKLPNVVLDNLKNVGFLNEILFRNDLILEKDRDEIKAIMKDVFFRVLEHNVEQRLEFFKPQLEKAYRPKQLLDERIKELQNKFDKAEPYYREEALKGGWSEIGIDDETFKKINDEKYTSKHFSLIQFTPKKQYERLGGFHPAFSDKYYQWQNIKFDVSEVFRFREKLIQFRDGELKPDKRKEGTHKDNKSWVIEKYLDVRSESDSDNDAVEKVMRAYQDEFEKRIGKSTVQRFVGLV